MITIWSKGRCGGRRVPRMKMGCLEYRWKYHWHRGVSWFKRSGVWRRCGILMCLRRMERCVMTFCALKTGCREYLWGQLYCSFKGCCRILMSVIQLICWRLFSMSRVVVKREESLTNKISGLKANMIELSETGFKSMLSQSKLMFRIWGKRILLIKLNEILFKKLVTLNQKKNYQACQVYIRNLYKFRTQKR